MEIPKKIVRDDGVIQWELADGSFHREDGPAQIYPNGTKFWYFNDLPHREDGPAIEWAGGSKEWYVNGLRHRIDGPASEYTDGETFWFINGKCINKEVAQWKKEMGITNDKLTPEESALFVLYFGNVS